MTHISHQRRFILKTMAAWSSVPVLWGCSQGDRAPDFDVVLLDGTRISREALLGKVTLVNFWATTCTTCVHEMPDLVKVHQQFQSQGFETLAVAMSYDPPAYVANFAQSRQLPFKVGIDLNGHVAKAWGDIRLTPTTFIVDRGGNIVKRYVGAPEMESLKPLIAKLLAA